MQTRLRTRWESIRHGGQDSTSLDIERHQRVVRALRAASSEHGRDTTTDARDRSPR
jgi:hypothetical protein